MGGWVGWAGDLGDILVSLNSPYTSSTQEVASGVVTTLLAVLKLVSVVVGATASWGSAAGTCAWPWITSSAAAVHSAVRRMLV